jgi:hypothetical protein
VEFTELKGNGQEKLEVDKWKYDDEFPEYQARLGEWVDDAEPEWEDVGCWSWAKATRLQDNQGGGHYLIRESLFRLSFFQLTLYYLPLILFALEASTDLYPVWYDVTRYRSRKYSSASSRIG